MFTHQLRGGVDQVIPADVQGAITSRIAQIGQKLANLPTGSGAIFHHARARPGTPGNAISVRDAVILPALRS